MSEFRGDFGIFRDRPHMFVQPSYPAIYGFIAGAMWADGSVLKGFADFICRNDPLVGNLAWFSVIAINEVGKERGMRVVLGRGSAEDHQRCIDALWVAVDDYLLAREARP